MAKEYIDREALNERIAYYLDHTSGEANYTYGVAIREIKIAPAANVIEVDGDINLLKEKMPEADWVGTKDLPIEYVPVVRCKDCKHWRHETEERIEHYECNIFCGAYGRGYPTGADDFCSYGERKEV
jgi:hypothetical protein